VVCHATLPSQRVLETTLARLVGDLEAHGMEPPAVLVVGRAVLMRQALDWQAMAAGVAPRCLDPLGRQDGALTA
jgi:uroporphyrin-III C-methyltransferase